MFFSNPEKRYEESRHRQITNVVYRLVVIIGKENLMHSVPDGKHRRCIDPWLSDYNKICEMENAIKGLNSEKFMEKYGEDLEKLSNEYF